MAVTSRRNVEGSVVARLRTDLLEIHYLDSGPRDGPVALLLHGWPDAPQTWNALAARLNAAGWRTIAPYTRGFGPNRFLDPATRRSGQLTALAADAWSLIDAIGVDRFAVVGHDWGARTAYLLAAGSSKRVTHCIALSVGPGPVVQPSLVQAQQFWYQWFLALPQGETALRADRKGLCEHLWRSWSPGWKADPASFAQAAAAFDNPDWIEVTLHAYRHRWQQVAGDPRYDLAERERMTAPLIDVPTLVLHGEQDRCIDPASSLGGERFFTSVHRRVTLPGVGHFPQYEAVDLVARAVLGWLGTPPTPVRGAAHHD